MTRDKDATMTKRYAAVVSMAIAAGALYGFAQSGPVLAAGGQNAPVSFKDDVQPIFKLYCASCHNTPDGAGFKASGLDLTTYKGVMTGTKYGPMIVAGDPENSNLMWLLDWRAGPALRMPHDKKQLPAGERDIIRAWIRQGAKDN
jgi:hypothetical protein